ncbi:hypothetical protein C6Y45_02425 [Alkalicoccus saliphilus]|uniref:Alkyl hydroperoxide reductase subunit C/ Thiol specific antioxidant domain-containing protein n=1 Tax=Alkalicoccus saliphilus TaxID=200989 RepID=A0A2T4UA34_9BACI|nr:hypothetical protein C6Y45_02425 [Alkalicoccus saliphilus]
MKELTFWKEVYSRLEKFDTEILGISVDHIFAQNVFETTLGTLPYPLLSDWRRKAVKDYEVLNDKDMVAYRSCFMISKEGKLIYKNENFDAEKMEHYEEILNYCRKLKGKD